MTTTFIYEKMRLFRVAALATSSEDHKPEAAVVGIALTPELEIVFDTLQSTRKYRNLVTHPKVAFVVWKGEMTIQYEGEVTELGGPEDESYRELYYSVYPEGRDRKANWEGLTHFVVKPTWVRFSDYTNEPGVIEELRF